jgi:hypothetical protein
MEPVSQEVFSMWIAYIHCEATNVFAVLCSDQSLYNGKPTIIDCSPRVEAGSNTSTLRVVGGDEKESLKCETVKYGLKSQGTRTRERLR